jgi:hypothetical protein
MALSLSSLRAQGVEMKVRQGEYLPALLFLRPPLLGYLLQFLVLGAGQMVMRLMPVLVVTYAVLRDHALCFILISIQLFVQSSLILRELFCLYQKVEKNEARPAPKEASLPNDSMYAPYFLCFPTF